MKYHWYGCTHGSNANLLTRKPYETAGEARREFRKTLGRPLPRHASVWILHGGPHGMSPEHRERLMSGKLVRQPTETCKFCKHRGSIYTAKLVKPYSSHWRVCPACDFASALFEYFRKAVQS